MSAQRKYNGMLVRQVTVVANRDVDWARNFIDSIDTPFGVVLTILFSVALGIGLNILLPRSDAPQETVPASNPAPPESIAPAPSLPHDAAAAPGSAPPIAAPPLSDSASATADHNEVSAMLARGRAYLAGGDVASARMLLQRAAERDNAEAALALARTYDPAELKRLGIPNLSTQADFAKAREWYRKAAEVGSAEAAARLQQLPKNGRSLAPLRAMGQIEPGLDEMPGAGPSYRQARCFLV